MILLRIVRRNLIRTCRARSAQREGAQAPDASPIFTISGEKQFQNVHLFFLFFINLRMPIELGMGEVSSYSVPSGFRADLHARPEGPSLMGWDGTVIKSVLQCSSYFVGI